MGCHANGEFAWISSAEEVICVLDGILRSWKSTRLSRDCFAIIGLSWHILDSRSRHIRRSLWSRRDWRFISRRRLGVGKCN